MSPTIINVNSPRSSQSEYPLSDYISNARASTQGKVIAAIQPSIQTIETRHTHSSDILKNISQFKKNSSLDIPNEEKDPPEVYTILLPEEYAKNKDNATLQEEKFVVFEGISLPKAKALGLPDDVQITAIMDEQYIQEKGRQLFVGGYPIDPIRIIWDVAQGPFHGVMWGCLIIRFTFPLTCPLLSVIMEGKIWKLFQFDKYSCCAYVPQAFKYAYMFAAAAMVFRTAFALHPIIRKGLRTIGNCFHCLGR